MRNILLLVFSALIAGCATQVQQANLKAAREVPQGADTKPIQFKKVIVKLRRGETIGKSHGGLACVPQGNVEWKGGQVNITDDEFTEAFREELEKYNYKVVGDPNALFEDPSAWKAELLVAGQISKLDISVCYPMAGFGNLKDSKGGAYVKVNWQIYGQLERRVLYEVTTEGSFQTDKSGTFGIEKSLTNAFAVATQNLLADERFHLLVMRKSSLSLESTSNASARVDAISVLRVPYATADATNAPTSLKRAIDSTVTVFAGSGHGSGFMISQDGHVLTNEHVVKEARFVTIRLSNGREIVGDVLRTDSARDVALIKLREKNLPFALLQLKTQANVGSEVFAVGTPRRENLDATVTKGIISAYRDDRNQKMIQSDVQIHPGNSGGPLVSPDGTVIGIAVQGLMLSGASQNLNFFIPIQAALSALRIEQ